MLKWHKPIKHVASVYLLFFTPSRKRLGMCAADDEAVRVGHEKMEFHVIRKVYSQVIYTFFMPRNVEAMWFLCFW